MTATTNTQRTCPRCKKPLAEKVPGIWPFCSNRCKQDDLAAWVREEYTIPVQEIDEEDLEQLLDLNSEDNSFN